MPDIYDWPHEWHKFTSTQFTLRTVAFGSRSVTSPRRNTRLAYQAFFVQGTYKSERGPSGWQDKEAFFSRLDGEAGLFRLFDSLKCQPHFNRNNFPAGLTWSTALAWSDNATWVSNALIPPTAVLASAALRGAKYLELSGLPASKTGALMPGDLIELRPDGIATETSNLYMVVAAANTDTAGETTVEVRPRLRQGFAAADMVVLQNAKGVFQLSDGEQGQVFREANVGSFGFTAVEYVD